jgi:hypothetical protein
MCRGYGDEATTQEPRIHICQRPEDLRRAKSSQGIGQHVFELTPTMLLNNPMLNPVHTHDANYFPPAPPMSHVSYVSKEPRLNADDVACQLDYHHKLRRTRLSV